MKNTKNNNDKGGGKKMMKMFLGFTSGTAVYLFGGFDALLHTLFLFIVLDIISGIISAGYRGELKSKEIKRGLVRKLSDVILVIVAVWLDKVITGNFMEPFGINSDIFFGGAVSIRTAVISLLIFREATSIFENLILMNGYVPNFLKKMLKVFTDKIDPPTADEMKVEAQNIQESAKKMEEMIDRLPEETIDNK